MLYDHDTIEYLKSLLEEARQTYNDALTDKEIASDRLKKAKERVAECWDIYGQLKGVVSRVEGIMRNKEAEKDI